MGLTDGQWAVDSVFREIVIVFYLDVFTFNFFFERTGWVGRPGFDFF